MQNVLAVFVGILTFLVMLVIRRRIKIKKKNRFFDIAGMVASLAMSIYVYYLMSGAAGLHYKLCCAYKSWVIALSLLAVYRQFFGEEMELS